MSQYRQSDQLALLNLTHLVFHTTFKSDPCSPAITFFNYWIQNLMLEHKLDYEIIQQKFNPT